MALVYFLAQKTLSWMMPNETLLYQKALPTVKTDNPVFIVGTERSGSNLMRLILNSHPNISVPHPPHILHNFSPLKGVYGDLENDANFHHLVDDILQFVNGHIHPWPITLSREKIISKADSRDLLTVFSLIYDEYLASTDKQRWGCKSTFVINHVEKILDRYPNAKFLWLIRDPRAVAASFRQSVFGPFHPYFSACLWRDQQTEGLRLEKNLSRDILIRIRYEDLLTDSKGCVKNICSFLEEPFDEKMLRYYETPEAAKTASLSRDWSNTALPILPDKAKKYSTDFTTGEIYIVESTVGNLLGEFGYGDNKKNATPNAPSIIQKCVYRLADLAWRIRVELRSLRNDRNCWRRWQRPINMATFKFKANLRQMKGWKSVIMRLVQGRVRTEV